MTEKRGIYFHVFRISSDIIRKSGLSLDVTFNKLYSISFTIGKANAILSFSLTSQEPENIKNATGFEVHFTKELLNKETIMLSEKLELFKSDLPRMFLISRHQEWRVNEIFESMLDESINTDCYRNEMIPTLMHGLILFSQRQLPEETNSV